MPLHEPITMPDAEHDQVSELHRILKLGLPELVGPNAGERIKIPPSVYQALKDIVGNMQQGRSVVVVPEETDFTTQRAASFLGVSRPHLIKLLESNEIPFHRTGSHRRIAFRDLVNYARRRNAERRAVLDSMAREAFAAGLYDSASMPPGAEDE